MDSEKNELVKIGVVARELGVTRNTIRDWVDKGLIDCITLPTGHRRFRREDIDKIKHPEKYKEGE